MKMRRLFSSVSIVLFFLLLINTKVSAQKKEDDLEALLEETEQSQKEYITGTFKGTRVINLQSTEKVAPGALQFLIQHRFGPINGGFHQFYGLDQAGIRFGLEYGICKFLSVSVGRSSYNKTFDGYVKATLIRQSKGKGSIPVSVLYFSSTAINGMPYPNPNSEQKNFFSSRVIYTNQLIIASKLSERFSFEVVPTFIHYNLAVAINDPNDLFAVGFGGRMKLSKRISFNAEWVYRIPLKDKTAPVYANNYNSLSFGFDIETGGHVFQIMLTNSLAMYEAGFITQTGQRWGNGGIQLGFNISRDFVLNKKKAKTKTW